MQTEKPVSLGPIRTPRGDEYARLVSEGESLSAVAYHFGVSPAAVHKACSRRGVQVMTAKRGLRFAAVE